MDDYSATKNIDSQPLLQGQYQQGSQPQQPVYFPTPQEAYAAPAVAYAPPPQASYATTQAYTTSYQARPPVNLVTINRRFGEV
jgi:hypothetical protein